MKLELNTEYTYSQICELLGWKVYTGGASKKAQINEIEGCYKFYHPINTKTHKEKKSYIFTEQVKEPVEPSRANNGGANNTKNIQPFIEWIANYWSGDEEFYTVNKWLIDEMNILNGDTANITYQDSDEIAAFLGKYGITNEKLFRDYVSFAKSELKKNFLNAIESMKKRDLIETNSGYGFDYILGRRKSSVLGHFVSFKMDDYIKQIETDVCNAMNEEHLLSDKMDGRRLLMIIYSNKYLTEEFKELVHNSFYGNAEIMEIFKEEVDCLELGHGHAVYIDKEEHPISRYSFVVNICGVDIITTDKSEDELLNMITQNVIDKTRKNLKGRNYPNKYTGEIIYPYEYSDCEMNIIERLLFTQCKQEISAADGMAELDDLFDGKFLAS